MAAIHPRHVLCILGNWPTLDEVEPIVARVGGPGFQLDREYSQLEPDGRMLGAFKASYDRVSPSMTDRDWRAIKKHTAVAYVLSPPCREKASLEVSRRALRLVGALLEAGGVAAKGESSGIAHGRDRWLELCADATGAASEGDHHRARAALYWACVRRPIQDDDDGVYYSCGMHLLGQRDVEIESTLDVASAVEWIDLLGLYLVADQPTRPVRDGDGFRLRDEGPRRVMRLRPCARYDDDEFFYSPYGYIRLENTGRSA
jgi:hypothetical protein